MSHCVLDTDTLTLLLRGHARVCQHVAEQDSNELCVSIITIEEMLRGWYTQIRRAKTDEQIERAYAALQQAVQVASRLPILAFDHAVIQRFAELRKHKLRIGTNDLKIAATVFENQAVLVTRNRSDFRRVPGLMFEDWS
jgi:tRNA(fMet)-specific endonuclease VapC